MSASVESVCICSSASQLNGVLRATHYWDKHPAIEPCVGGSEWVQGARRRVENKTEAVILHQMRASTKVMAAGTVIEPMTAQTAEEISAKEFAHVVETHRPQIFRFLLCVHARCRFGRDAHAGLLFKGASQLEPLPRRVDRNDVAHADCDQSAERSLAQPPHAILAADQDECC